MVQAGLITRDVCRKADYEAIMSSFQAGLDLKETLSDLEHDCNKFVNALKEVGGPARKAAEHIAKQWKCRVQKEFEVEFCLKLQPLYKCFFLIIIVLFNL